MALDDPFVHLHCHTDYSMLDGAGKIKDLVAETVRQEQPAVAITDHGYLFGAYEHYEAATQAGIKPIVGVEAYVTPGTSRFDRTKVRWGTEEQKRDDVSGGGAYNHLTLLAKTTEGMHNLFRMGSYASLEGQMGKWPRMDRDLLSTYADGLIASTGCPSGEVQTRLRLGQFDEALRAAGELQEIFGKENFYVELMDHGLDLETRTFQDLLRIARTIDAPLVATNDSHYVREEQAKIQDAMLCLNSGSTLLDPDRFSFNGTGYFLRSSREMRELFKELPEACDNTLRIAEQCNVEFRTADDGVSFMPNFPTPAGEDETSWFTKEVQRGLDERYPEGIPTDVQERADYEVGVINTMDFPGYFLITADYIKWAKEQGIRVGPGRGSAVGSMVAYALRITDLDPIAHGLFFERFLNPERISMPDIDVDFDDRRRDEVLDYVTERYGEDKISQVVTYGVIKTKQALKDSSRVLGYPFQMGEKLTKALPPAAGGKDIPLAGIYDRGHERYGEAEEFRQTVADDPDAQQVLEVANGLEGLTRQWGVHACAVIMSSHSLVDVVPMMQRLSDGQVITQFDYPTCEHLGLLKMDFLGLRNLTVISDCFANIAQNGKEAPDLEHLGLDDAKTYELMTRGDTLGVFQLDGSGMRSLLKQMKPDKFGDVSAVSALYRPGPMGMDSHTNYALRKNGLQAITPIHPELEGPLSEILGETYGLIVYQEQVMQIATKVAGFSLGQADILRKAMGKKKKAAMDEQFVQFRQGMLDNGFSDECIKSLWDVLVPFSAYAFNKSHSAAYGVISYWTAYLKAHFPTEYMAALLTSTGDNRDRLGLYLNECRHMGITVLPPDVNESTLNFSAVGADIRFGLGAVRNVGRNVVDEIVAARGEQGAYTSFTDFLDKVPLGVCNKRTVDSLIKGGGFDTTGVTRRALTTIHTEAVDSVVDTKRKQSAGQFDLFSDLLGGGGDESGSAATITVPDIPEWDRKQKLAFERDMLGLYVSDHPLNGLEHIIGQAASHTVGQLSDPDTVRDNDRITVAGLITGIARKTTKKGDMWAIVTVEDLEGSIECKMFPKTYRTVATELAPETVVAVSGRADLAAGATEMRVEEMTLLDTSRGTDAPVVISLPSQRATNEVVEALRGVLEANPGMSEVRMRLTQPGRTTLMQLGDNLHVTASPALFASLKTLLGPACLSA